MATKGQHVGAVRDSLTEDADQSAARASARAIARLARPQKPRTGHSTGDGDICPLFPHHGRMLTIPPSKKRQQCTDQSHDGRWSREGHEPPTRSFWSVANFNTEVAAYHRPTTEAALPDLDIDLGGLS